MKKYLVEYSTTNSGGNFWLTTKNWKALENAGWKLFNHDEFIYAKRNYIFGKDGLPKRKSKKVKDTMFSQYAHYAFKRFNNIIEALQEFERLTGADISDEGCNCCGAPHTFSWEDKKGNRNHCSGKSSLEYLYPDKKIPTSLREILIEK